LLGLEVEGAEGGRPNLRVRGGGGDREDLSWDGGRAGRSYTLAAPVRIARKENYLYTKTRRRWFTGRFPLFGCGPFNALMFESINWIPRLQIVLGVGVVS